LNDRKQGVGREEEEKRDIIDVVSGIAFLALRIWCLLLELMCLLINLPIQPQRTGGGQRGREEERHY